MKITYANGQTIEGILLARNDENIRVALKGCEDVAEFTSLKGAWISEKCEAIKVRYEWQRRTRKQAVSESDCICSKELTARLVQLLSLGDETKIQIGTPGDNRQQFPPCLPAA